jgi:hypothetical protein
MKNFYRWMFRYARNKMEQQEKYETEGLIKMHGAAQMVERGMGDPDLNFRMYKAENGHVMEVRHYDRRTDRHQNKLYLITDEQDLGAEISKIITVESLRS